MVNSRILLLTDVVVAFGALRAVNHVTIGVKKGERRAIIGPNGAGKTTLFNAVTGVNPPISGSIRFDDHVITHLPPHRRARLGISRTFQITNLFPSLTVRDNMVLALRAVSPRTFSLFGRAEPDPHEAARIAAALERAKIDARSDTEVRELSYGEQRQLEIALSLVAAPRLLLFDEPAAGLSPAERSIVADIIRSLDRELTVVLIEHDMDLALGLVDSVTCLHDGKVLVEASPAEIRSDRRVQEVYLGKPRDA